MASASQEWVFCPACRVQMRVTSFLGHYARRCPSLPTRDATAAREQAKALLPTLPRGSRLTVIRSRSRKLIQQALQQASYERGVDGRHQSRARRSSRTMLQTTLQTTCRFCGQVAIPGERVCYSCAQGGG